MSLTNKIRTLVLGATLTACGGEDIHNHYYTGNDSGSQGNGVQINDCQDFANRLYECDPQSFVDYEKQWGLSIDWQRKHAAKECIKGNYFQSTPKGIECLEQNSCADINAGVCEQYFSEF